MQRMKMDIYVARPDMKISKPCEYCGLLKHFGINRVIYSDGKNYTIEKVSEIKTNHISQRDRKYKSNIKK
jgi:hypothetical protein